MWASADERACVYHMLIGQTLMECHTGENRVVSLFSYLQPFCVYAKQNVIHVRKGKHYAAGVFFSLFCVCENAFAIGLDRTERVQ